MYLSGFLVAMEIKFTGCPKPTPEELQDRWEKWTQAMELSNAMLMAGLRAQVGPDGDIQAAYRDWYNKYQSLKWKEVITDEPSSEPIDAT